MSATASAINRYFIGSTIFLNLVVQAKINRDKDAAARQLQALRARRHIREPPLEAAATGNGKDK